MEKEPQYKTFISDRARYMLAENMQFLAQKSPTAARKVKTEIISAIRSLNQMPERFPFLETEYIPPNKYHKIVVEKWYLILYQIKDKVVFVDYIVDSRQDYWWLIK